MKTLKNTVIIAICLAFSQFQGVASETVYDITLKQLGVDKSEIETYGYERQCYLIYLVNSRRSFNNRNSAWDYCNNTHNRHNFSDRCYVRNFGDNNWESQFRHIGYVVGRGNNWRDARNNGFNNFNNFLEDRNFFRSEFDFQFRFDNDCY